MATILSIADIIECGEVSNYLSANYTSKQQLFGGNITKPVPPTIIAMVTDGLSWGNAGGAQTAASLRATANYLYWLTGQFQLQAQNIINGAGGGSVAPTPGGSTLPNPYDFEVGATPTSDAPLADGYLSVTLSLFIGYNVEFSRGGIVQNTTNIGGSYFSWNRVTGLFSVSPAVATGELLRITPVG